MAFKILIIEDEPLIALQVKTFLSRKGFEVVGCCDNFSEAYDLFTTHRPEITITDIRLSNDESGIDIIKELKKAGSFEVLFLTSFSDQMTLKKAFETKPFYYLTKPFKEIDLYTAVMLCARKLQEGYLDSDWHYDPVTRMLKYRNEVVFLTKQEQRLFHLCYRNLGQFVPLEVVENVLWDDKYVSDSTRRGLIHRLSKKIGKEIFEYSSIYGCRLIL
nr:response regulator [uncultured Desulfuromonas sp.]